MLPVSRSDEINVSQDTNEAPEVIHRLQNNNSIAAYNKECRQPYPINAFHTSLDFFIINGIYIVTCYVALNVS